MRTRQPDRLYVQEEHYIFYESRNKPDVGDLVTVNTRTRKVNAKVVKVGRHNVDVDTNHPLAGKTLKFDIEVINVREATFEEVSHRHAHGPGGHQH